MTALTALEKLQEIYTFLPLEVMQDIDKRVGDWLASGGGEDDSYIYQQLRYAERIIDLLEVAK